VTHETWLTTQDVKAVVSVAKNLAQFLPKYGKAVAVTLPQANVQRMELEWLDAEEQVGRPWNVPST
jgi:hypothetical protein